MTESSPSPLLQLPVELWIEIFGHISNPFFLWTTLRKVTPSFKRFVESYIEIYELSSLEVYSNTSQWNQGIQYFQLTLRDIDTGNSNKAFFTAAQPSQEETDLALLQHPEVHYFVAAVSEHRTGPFIHRRHKRLKGSHLHWNAEACVLEVDWKYLLDEAFSSNLLIAEVLGWEAKIDRPTHFDIVALAGEV